MHIGSLTTGRRNSGFFSGTGKPALNSNCESFAAGAQGKQRLDGNSDQPKTPAHQQHSALPLFGVDDYNIIRIITVDAVIHELLKLPAVGKALFA